MVSNRMVQLREMAPYQSKQPSEARVSAVTEGPAGTGNLVLE
ncbi:hypothetical protein SAMN05443572_101801 [Myxococcus fulvus]|uniref:Uncharacterized protein n=1 Tax=Myxococcus fulvus TaxID=33 RepID=A0ABY1BXA3_MYXFU|nr:hypothetical protein SAMN05443572_101801 [Myxococcus fulvus]